MHTVPSRFISRQIAKCKTFGNPNWWTWYIKNGKHRPFNNRPCADSPALNIHNDLGQPSPWLTWQSPHTTAAQFIFKQFVVHISELENGWELHEDTSLPCEECMWNFFSLSSRDKRLCFQKWSSISYNFKLPDTQQRKNVLHSQQIRFPTPYFERELPLPISSQTAISEMCP